MAYDDFSILDDIKTTAQDVTKVVNKCIEEANEQFNRFINKLNGRSLTFFASLLNIDPPAASHIRSGRRVKIQPAYCEIVCDTLKMSAHELLTGEDHNVELYGAAAALMNVVYVMTPEDKQNLLETLKEKYESSTRPTWHAQTYDENRLLLKKRLYEIADGRGTDIYTLPLGDLFKNGRPQKYKAALGRASLTLSTFIEAEESASIRKPLVRLTSIIRIALYVDVAADYLVCLDYTQTAKRIEYTQFDVSGKEPRKQVLYNETMKEILSLWLRLPDDLQSEFISDVFFWAINCCPDKIPQKALVCSTASSST